MHVPWVNPSDVQHGYNLEPSLVLQNQKCDVVALGVANKEFLNLNFSDFLKKCSLLYEVKEEF